MIESREKHVQKEENLDGIGEKTYKTKINKTNIFPTGCRMNKKGEKMTAAEWDGATTGGGAVSGDQVQIDEWHFRFSQQ